MRYSIEHLTHYAYNQPVGLSLQVAHLRPRNGGGQTCLSHTLGVSPRPQRLVEDEDYFGNPIARFEIATAHRSLDIIARSQVDVQRTGTLPERSEAWESVAAFFAETRWGDNPDSAAGEYLFASAHVPRVAGLREYAAASFLAGRETLEAAQDLMHRIHTDFKFDPSATQVATPMESVLSMRRGVCQDFAHLMVGCLRAMGLPARYVSGYLLTEPPPGKPRLIGADASHAWVSLYLPGQGWFDFDPTNDVNPADTHIALGWGRDFADVSPLRGVIQGGGKHQVEVAVTVTPSEEKATP